LSFLPLYVYFICLSFLISLSLFYRIKGFSYLKLFPPFLFVTLVTEILASYFWSIGRNNLGLYNFFTVFEFCFYLFVIRLIIGSKKVKIIIQLTCILYAIAAIVNILFIQSMKTFHTVTYSIGCLLIVIFCIYYFLELFRLPRFVNLVANPAFWICSGLLFFYCCGFPLYGLVNYWQDISPLVLNNFTTIFTILNIFLYSLFTIAFLCNKTMNYTS
jgi:hypothetical protein